MLRLRQRLRQPRKHLFCCPVSTYQLKFPQSETDIFIFTVPYHFHFLYCYSQTWGDYNTNVIGYNYLPPARLRLRINKIANVIDYDYVESNHDYNRDYFSLQTSSERKHNPFAWFDVSIFQAIKIRTNAINDITNHQGVGTEKKKNHINCLFRYLRSQESTNTLNIN